MHPHSLFLGVDLGTGGVRALAVTETGGLTASVHATLDQDAQVSHADQHEQDPESWWAATCKALRALVAQIHARDVPLTTVRALAVDGTSGTLVCMDEQGRPIRPAIMYNDPRAQKQAEELSQHAEPVCRKLGYRIAASFAIAKIRWLQENEPEHFALARWFGHQADFIANRLTGEYGVTDYSNALKTGYDLLEEDWPPWVNALTGVRERLPQVVAPGTKMGVLRADLADDLGLPADLPIVAGATDGTAGFLASGANKVGDDNTTLGSTLVFKRLSDKLTTDSSGLIYSHKLPSGFWLPGAASNTGGEWIRKQYPDSDLDRLDLQARDLLPCDHLAYPLARQGERFPFKASTAKAFCHPQTSDRARQYAANLQGVALVERLCYARLTEATGLRGHDIYATGGGSRSDVWMQLRADVMGRAVHRAACPESAFGSAVLAAVGTHFPDLWSAVRQMVHIDRTFVPTTALANQYDDKYHAFKELLRGQGYLS